MFGSAIIVFREILEAALVVSIVAAATRGIPGRRRLLLGGVALGIVGAVLVALFADGISQFADGSGQAIFNAGILLLAAALIAWHVLWMSSHGREMAHALTHMSQAVRDGQRAPSALMVVVAVAVLREGSEIALFLYGMAAGGVGVVGLAGGGALGVLGGVAAGAALYFGLLRIPPGKLFSATNWILVLVAAGMASHAAQYLMQADWIPTLGAQVWDTSWLAGNASMMGRTLNALVGYDAQPAGVQLLFFATTLATILGAGRLLRQRKQRFAASIAS
ncbi:MAG TPA: FTR1 family protein [Nevskiaceae bacterium]|nr:FTR1 family protein [Nevskiaceae bacterium]